MAKGLRITRRAGERIFIGDDIIIEIENTTNGRTGVRVMAPSDVEIHRDAARVSAPSRKTER